MKTFGGQLERRTMQCMEIRGGSLAVEEALDAPGLQEWIYSQPYKSAARGGDVHYVSLCASGTISRLILADVSGHGAAVAEVAVALRSLMEKNMNVESQTRMVQMLNRQFAEIAEMQRFATAVVATYLTADHSLTVCNAGHPRPLWRHASGGSWDYLGPALGEVGNLPWGLDEETPYQQFSVNLEPGDLLLFYTDALIAAVDQLGRQLGEHGLLRLAHGLETSDPVRTGRALRDAVAAHRGGRDADDDVTIVAWMHTGNSPSHFGSTEQLLPQ
jgi:phosphoserine phosphatase RsbU/P